MISPRNKLVFPCCALGIHTRTLKTYMHTRTHTYKVKDLDDEENNWLFWSRGDQLFSGPGVDEEEEIRERERERDRGGERFPIS